MAALASSGTRGWRAQARDLPGTPDVAFTRMRLAVFVDGCFWHGCPNCYRRPKSSQAYWDGKVARNVSRDRNNRNRLRRMGWAVLRFWEHEVAASPIKCVEQIRKRR